MRKIALALISTVLLTGCSEVPVAESPTAVTVYFSADTPVGMKLFSETRDFSDDGQTLAFKVISELVSGSLQPLDPDYTNLWDESTSLNEILIQGDQATVDLNLGKLNVGAEGEARAIDQIVWTLTGISPELTSVAFLANGETIQSFAGHVDTTASFKRQLSFEVLSPVQITSLLEGQFQTNPVLISGEACTFEANVSWGLFQGNELVGEGSTTALEACPVRSAWSVQLKGLAAGSYSFVVREFSAQDGTLIAIDSKSFVVK
jgi:hypothetical protein